jgi:methionine synthase II (cobalamin-independent)
LKESLTLRATAVGSLPHDDIKKALDLDFGEFADFPFWPQLAACNKNDDMILQFVESIPGCSYDKSKKKWVFDAHGDKFYEDLENFFIDYESIIAGDTELLEKYAITEEFSCAMEGFLEGVKKSQPPFIKAQVTGPFTWGTMLVDTEGKCAFYDDTLREIIVRALAMKALWQIKKFKEISPESTPVIFLDEPSMSQYGTSAFITVKREDIVDAIKQIAEVLQENGALVGVHCCGKTDWSMIIDSGVDIINFDGFYFGESLALYAKQIEKFLKNGGYIAWGIVPTLDKDALEASTLESLIGIFENSKEYLLKKKLDEKLIMQQSFITPSCGAGSLDIPNAEKAMKLCAQIAKTLHEKYEKELK